MEIKRILSFFAVALVIMLNSCKKDEALSPIASSARLIRLEGITYDLDESFILNLGESSFYQGTKYRFYAATEGIEFIYDSNGLPADALGKGYTCFIDFYAPSDSFINAGTYCLEPTNGANLFTISDGGALSYGLATALQYQFLSGSLELSKNNEISTLVGSFRDTNGRKVTVYFQGKLQVIDAK